MTNPRTPPSATVLRRLAQLGHGTYDAVTDTYQPPANPDDETRMLVTLEAILATNTTQQENR